MIRPPPVTMPVTPVSSQIRAPPGPAPPLARAAYRSEGPTRPSSGDHTRRRSGPPRSSAASVPWPRRPGCLGRAPRTGAPAPPRAGRERAGLRWWRSCCRATTGRDRAGHPGESPGCAGWAAGTRRMFHGYPRRATLCVGIGAGQSTGHGIDKAVLRIRAVGRCRLRATARGSAPKDHVRNEPTAVRCARWRSLDVIRASADRTVSDQSFRDSRLHPAEGETDAYPVHVLRHSDPHVFLR